MDKKLFYKIGGIALMMILLLIPLSMVERQIRDRSQRQNEVQESIANGAAGEQMLAGPFLAVDYRETSLITPDENNTKPRQQVVERTLLLPAQLLEIDGQGNVETRHRGIYQARLFQMQLTNKGHFVVPPLASLLPGKQFSDARLRLILRVSDPRGINNDPQVQLNGQTMRFSAPKRQGSGESPRQMEIALGSFDTTQEYRLNFSFPLQLTGTTRLAIAPTGEANRISLKSDWPHPNFGGRFLPGKRNVSESGFDAQWEVSHLARNFDATLNPKSGENLSIDFVDPVNIYLQAERAVKYGLLFVALTFAGFFLTEILRRAPIHPLQYLLVGLALATFFLLLIAFSEHLPFIAAYGLAATACIGLIAFYLAGALGGWQQGAAFGGGLTGLYGVLYGVLLSEDNALLMGSVLLFLALGTIMLATRKLDWYSLGKQLTAGGEGAE